MLWYYCVWFALSFAASVVMFFLPAYAYYQAIVDKSGRTDGVWAEGFAVFATMVTVHHIQVYISTRNYTRWLFGFYVLSYLLFFPLVVVLNDFDLGSTMYRSTFTDILTEPQFWLSFILATAVISLPLYLIKSIRYNTIIPEFAY